jgi:hypothetical protein
MANNFANPLAAILEQMNRLATRRDTIDRELEDLQRQQQLAINRADQSHLISERDRLLAEATNGDPTTRYDARSRIAAALRETVAKLRCYPDKSTRIDFVSANTPHIHWHPYGYSGQDTITITSRLAVDYGEYERYPELAPVIVRRAGRKRYTDRAEKKYMNSIVGLTVSYGADLKPTYLLRIDERKPLDVSNLDPEEIGSAISGAVRQSS